MRLPVIVFVDDEESVTASLRSMFRRSGYSTYAFSDAASALEFLMRVPADLVMCDLHMPRMTGLEFLTQVSFANPHAIRVTLSGGEDREVVLDALSKGLAHHNVVKPWNEVLVRDLVHRALDGKEGVRRQQLEKVLGSIEHLPAPPSFHVRLQAELARDGSSVYDIAREIEKSPPIVAKLLRVANSVYFARRKSIMTVHDAVFLIGTGYISGLVGAIEAFHGFASQSRPDFTAHIERLWTESFKRATVAKRIAEKWSGFDAPQTLYIASLLQDIGYAVVLWFDPEVYAEYVKTCEEGIVPPHEAEQKIFDYMHDTVGAALLDYWNLPPAIVTAVEKHHQRTEGDAFLQILQIADSLCPGMRSSLHDPAIDELIVLWRGRMLSDLDAIQMMPTG